MRICGSMCCWRRISAPPATAMSRSPSGTAAGVCYGPSRGRSAWRSPPPTRTSATPSVVLRAHLDKTFPGAMVASLSIPWGDTGDQRSGYHLVWPRDLVECAGGLLALGGEDEAVDTLRYLIATQNEDGHWHQNQWL